MGAESGPEGLVQAAAILRPGTARKEGPACGHCRHRFNTAHLSNHTYRMNLQVRARALERAKARLRDQETALRKETEAAQRLHLRLQTLVRDCGLAPRDLAFALVEQFHLRLAGRRKGSHSRRHRTKITTELRETLKHAVAGGASKLATARKFRLSYAVVTKAVNGGYDRLR